MKNAAPIAAACLAVACLVGAPHARADAVTDWNATAADDGATAADRYRPHAAPGAYVPTAAVAAPQWARDYDEVETFGGKASRARTPEQTEIARFWEYSSAAHPPRRRVDDAQIAVMNAKYHYGFWRPVTAIRNGDRDDNPATEVDAGWTPLIENPGHPDYPSAHSITGGQDGQRHAGLQRGAAAAAQGSSRCAGVPAAGAAGRAHGRRGVGRPRPGGRPANGRDAATGPRQQRQGLQRRMKRGRSPSGAAATGVARRPGRFSARRA